MELLKLVAGLFTASLPIQLGVIGDRASGRETSSEYEEFLPPNLTAIHRYEIRIEDKKGFLELLGDSFHARVRLERAPPGLEICVQMKPAHITPLCGKTYYELPGKYGVDDTQDVNIWISWHLDARRPVSGTYKLTVSGV